MIRKRFRLILALAVIVAILPFLHFFTGISAQSVTGVQRSPDEQLTISAYKQTNEAVVFISTVTLTIDPFDFFREIRPQKGSGSGIIVDAKQGIIVTNLHVIQNAHQISIHIGDDKQVKAKLLGYDEQYDLAVLQLENVPTSIKAIRFGDSASLEVGQKVLAIGNPFGLDRTLTTGIISSLHRTVKNPNGGLMKDLIQTDAAINPGNSGGPLLDRAGRLIGINTAILSQSGDSAGIGFAVPINQVKRILPQLIKNGRVLKPYFGWVLVDTTAGPMVRRVMPDSPAEEQGIQAIERMVSNVFMKGYVRDFSRAEIILSCNGKRVSNVNAIEDVISEAQSKESFTFELKSAGSGVKRTVIIKPDMK